MAGNMITKLPITAAAYQELLAICERIYPYEACGLLACSDGGDTIDIVLPIQNVHEHPEDSFAFHPAEWTNAFFGMQKNRQQLAGFFHSHPHSHAQPSARDYAGFPPAQGMSCWIVSLQERDRPVIEPYRMQDGRFEPIPLVLA